MNPATEFSVFFGAVFFTLKTIYELVMLLKASTGAGGRATRACNYPADVGGCIFANRDSMEMRTAEIVKGVSGELMPEMREQSIVLRDIRDGVRNLNYEKS